MRLKEGFIVHQSKNETVLVPTGESGVFGIVKGNATFGNILSKLESDISEDDLIAALAELYDDAPQEVLIRDVRRALDELRSIGALEE